MSLILWLEYYFMGIGIINTSSWRNLFGDITIKIAEFYFSVVIFAVLLITLRDLRRKVFTMT